MATYNVATAKSATLSGTTADDVTVQLGAYARSIEIVNWSGAEQLTVTIDGATPTALMDDGLVVMPGSSLVVPMLPRIGPAVVRLVGNGNAYTVQVL